jgi:hypothetical protein
MIVVTNKPVLLFCLVSITLILSACGFPSTSPAATTPALSTSAPTSLPGATATAPAAATASPQPSATLTPTFTATPSPTETAAPVPTNTPTAAPIPTYVKLRGEVIIDQAVCHYGPGAPYLYKYGVYKGSNLEIIARAQPGDYIEVQAIQGNNPCWVNPKYMQIKGNLANVQPIDPLDVKLPMSPYYKPPTNYSARRDGSTVTVFWSQLVLRPGDDSLQIPYIVEAWVCRNGQIVFEPVGTRQLAVKIEDEPSCSTPSHARLIAAEKHGYTRPVNIPWPRADAQVTATP